MSTPDPLDWREIAQRYHRAMDGLDLSPGSQSRCQLAFDLGVLVGTIARLEYALQVARENEHWQEPTGDDA